MFLVHLPLFVLHIVPVEDGQGDGQGCGGGQQDHHGRAERGGMKRWARSDLSSMQLTVYVRMFLILGQDGRWESWVTCRGKRAR